MSCLELIRPEALLQVSYLKHMPGNLVILALSLYETVIKTADSEPVHNKWSLLSGASVHVCVCGMWIYTWECGRQIQASSSSFLENEGVGFGIKCVFSETRHVREAAVIIHIVSRLSHQRDCIMHSSDWALSIAHPVSPLKKMHNSVVMTTCYSDGIKWFHTQGKCKSDWLCIMHPEWCPRARWECWWAQDEFPSKQTRCRVSHMLWKTHRLPSFCQPFADRALSFQTFFSHAFSAGVVNVRIWSFLIMFLGNKS